MLFIPGAEVIQVLLGETEVWANPTGSTTPILGTRWKDLGQIYCGCKPKSIYFIPELVSLVIKWKHRAFFCASFGGVQPLFIRQCITAGHLYPYHWLVMLLVPLLPLLPLMLWFKGSPSCDFFGCLLDWCQSSIQVEIFHCYLRDYDAKFPLR